MGVMSCSRYRCDNIMCHTYINSIGYICSECKSEFKKYLELKGLVDLSENEIKKELEIFMQTEKDEFNKSSEKMDIDDFFDQYTRD
jgi:hypothetical protein